MLWGMPLDWVRRHCAGAVRQGLDFDALMTSSLIDVRHGDNRDRVSAAQFLLLCMITAVGVDDAAPRLAGNSRPWDGFRLWLDFVDDPVGVSAPIRAGGLGAPALGELARRAGVSPATIRRRLQPIQGGYRQGRQRALADIGVAMLRDS